MGLRGPGNPASAAPVLRALISTVLESLLSLRTLGSHLNYCYRNSIALQSERYTPNIKTLQLLHFTEKLVTVT